MEGQLCFKNGGYITILTLTLTMFQPGYITISTYGPVAKLKTCDSAIHLTSLFVCFQPVVLARPEFNRGLVCVQPGPLSTG